MKKRIARLLIAVMFIAILQPIIAAIPVEAAAEEAASPIYPTADKGYDFFGVSPSTPNIYPDQFPGQSAKVQMVGYEKSSGTEFGNNRMVMKFPIGASKIDRTKTISRAELILHGYNLNETAGYIFFARLYGSNQTNWTDTNNVIPGGMVQIGDKHYKSEFNITSSKTATLDVTDYLKQYIIDNPSQDSVSFMLEGPEGSELGAASATDVQAFVYIYDSFVNNPSLNPTLQVYYYTNTPPSGTISINGGAAATSSEDVMLSLTGTDNEGDTMQMRFSNDGTTWGLYGPFASTFSWTLTAGDGMKTVYYQLIDSKGAESPVYSDSITLDTTPPNGALTINNGNAFALSTNVTLSISNPDGSAAQMRFQNGSGAWSAWEPYAALKSWTLDTGDGLKTVHVGLRDAAGNVATASDTIELDTVPPDGSIVINNSMATHTNSAAVTLSLDNQDGTAVQMQFQNESGAWSGWEAFAPTKSWTLSAGDGLKTVSVQLRDEAGNIRADVDTITLDTAAPTILGVTDGGLYNTDVTITWNEPTATAKLNGAAFTSGTVVTDEGSYSLVVTDPAGNTALAAFEIDKTAPNGTVSINAGAAYTTSTAVNLTIDNPDTTAEEMRFQNESGAWSGWEAVGLTKSWTLDTGDGTKTVNVQLRDAAGNVMGTSDTITLDTVAPTILNVINGGLYNTDQTLDWTEGSGDLNGSPVSQGDTLSADGVYTLTVTDPAGNSASATFEIDKTAPDGTVSIQAGASYTTSTAVDLTIANPDGTAVQMRFQNAGGAWSGWEAFAPTKSWTLDTGDGTKTVNVQLQDTAGNVSTESDTIELDTTPPDRSIAINGSATHTNSTSVTLTLDNPDGTAVEMQFQNESGAWSAWEPYVASKSWTLSTGDGTKTVNMQLRDAAGNAASASDTITLDTVAPTILNVPDGGLYNTDQTLDWTEGSGELNGSPVSQGDTLSTEGVYTLTVTDLAGNSMSVTFEIDKTEPDGTVSIQAGASYTTSIAVDLTITNPDGTAVEMRFQNAGGTWSSWEPHAASKSWTLDTSDGTKTVVVELRDAAGNVFAANDTIILDTTAPNGSLLINGGAGYTNNVSVTLDVANPDTTAVEMRFQNESGTWSAWETYAASKSWTLTAGEGTKTVNMQLRDAAGNVLDAANTIVLDTTAPTVTGVTNNGEYNTTRTVHYSDGLATLNGAPFSSDTDVVDEGDYTLVVTDSAGNTTTVQFKIDKTAPAITGAADGHLYNTDITITLSDGNAELNGAPFTSGTTITADGIYTLSVTDTAGNNASITFEIDKTAPDGALSINSGDTYTTSDNVTLSISNPDGTAVQMRFQNAGGAWSGWEAFAPTKSWTLETGDGTKTVNVQLQDTAGNVSTESDTIELDTTPPDRSIAINGTATHTNSTSVTLTLDNLDGTAVEMQFQNESGAWSGWEAFAPTKSWTLEAGDGLKTVNVQLRDAAGNAASASDTITLDTVAPTILNVINGGLYNTDQTLDWTEGSGDLNGSPVSQGDTLSADGVYTLTVTDPAGNSTSVTFEIDKTAPDGTVSIQAGASYTASTAVDLTIANPDGTAVQMRFQNAGGAWSGWEAFAPTKSWTLDTGDGTKTVNVQLQDTAGNVSTESDTIELDTTPPDRSIVINGSATHTNSTSVTLTLDNPDGTAAEMQFQNESGAWSAWEAFAPTKGWTLEAGDGLKTVNVQLRDEAGNAASASDTITLDTVAPTILNVTDGGLYNTDQTLDWTEGSGDLNGSPVSQGDTLSADGVYTLTVTDLAGNSASVTFEIDKTAPDGTVSIQAGASYTTSTAVDLTITNPDGTAVEMRFQNAAGAWSGWEAFAPTKSWTLDTGDGTKTVVVELRDAAGNVFATNDTIILDTTAPNGSLLINGGAGYTNNVSVTLDAANPDTTAVEMRFQNESGTWSAWETYAASKSWTLTAGEGTKTVNMQLRDAAGNVLDAANTIVLDTTAPTVTGVANNGEYNTTRTVHYSDGLATLNGAPFSNDTDVAAEGDYTLVVTDSAGNTTTVQFKIDKTAPAITGAADGQLYNTDITITLSDGNAELNGAPFTSGTTITADGIYTLTVTDTAGNSASITFEIDKTAPDGALSINSGDTYTNGVSVDLSISNSDGTAAMMQFKNQGGTWSGWEAIGSTKNWTLASGDGTQQVYLQLKDAAGNIVEISSSIILDTTKPTGTFTINNGDTWTTLSTVTAALTAKDENGVTDLAVSTDNGATWTAWTAFAASVPVTLSAGFGDYTILVKLMDAAGNESLPLTDTIKLRSVPSLQDSAVNAAEDTTYTFSPADFDFTNADGTALDEIQIVTLPEHGQLQLSGTDVTAGQRITVADIGRLTFIPELNWNGSTTFQWSAEAAGAVSPDQAVMTINAAPVNDQPVADMLTYKTTFGNKVEGQLKATDVDGDTLVYSIVDQPATGKLTLDTATGAFTFIPASEGKQSFTYRAFDGTDYSAAATVEVTNEYPYTGGGSTPEEEQPIIGIEGTKDANFRPTPKPTNTQGTVRVEISGDEWLKQLEGRSGDRLTITVVAKAAAVNLTVAADIAAKLGGNNRDLVVKLNDRTVTIPANTLARFAAKMTEPNAVLRIELAELDASEVARAEEAAQRAGASIAAEPVKFKVYIESAGKLIYIPGAQGAVSLTYPASQVTGGSPTTAVMVTDSGKMKPLPTKLVTTNSAVEAHVFGLTDGIFALIQRGTKFSDIAGHWAEPAINRLSSRLIVDGLGNGVYSPNGPATRAQFSSILVQAFGLYGSGGTIKFKDTKTNAWYAEALASAVENGLITGYTDGSFRPNASITREEAMVIMGRAAELVGLSQVLTPEQVKQTLAGYADANKLHGWARESAALCISLGIISGSGGNLHPDQLITRAQLAVMIDNLLAKAELI